MGIIDDQNILKNQHYTESEIFILRIVHYFMMNNKDKSKEIIGLYLNNQGISNDQFEWALNENKLS